jgi:hypothetical protein
MEGSLASSARTTGEVHDVLERTNRHLSSGRAGLGKLMGGIVEVDSGGAWITTDMPMSRRSDLLWSRSCSPNHAV